MINVYTAPEFSNEYFDAMESAFALIEDESDTVLLESAMFELGIFTDSIVNGSLSVTKEEVSLGELAHKKITERNVKGAWEHVKYFFEKIINFISDTTSKFLDTALNMFQSYEEWFEQNRPKVDPQSMDPQILSQLSFTVIPYFRHKAFERLGSNNGIQGVTDIEQAIKELDNREPMKNEPKDYIYQTYFKPLYDINNSDPKMASMMYWRGFDKDNTDFAAMKFAGTNGEQSAAKALNEMIAFCSKYKVFANQAKNMNELIKKKIETVSRERDRRVNRHDRLVDKGDDTKYKQDLLRTTEKRTTGTHTKKPKGVGEAYYFDEDMYSVLEGRSLFGLEDRGFEIVNEADVVTTASASKNTKQDKKVKAYNEKVETNFQKTKEYAKNRANAGDDIVALCKIHNTIATSRMTASEEIFRHYVKIMQDIAAAIDNLAGREKTDRENREYNERQRERIDRRRGEQLDEDAYRRYRASQNKGVLTRAKDALVSNDKRY